MTKPTYEQLEQERDELAAQVERLRFDDVDILRCLKTIAFHHNHDEINAYMPIARRCMEKITDRSRETPPAALAALKAQWQAEATDRLFHCLFYAPSSPAGPKLAVAIKEWWPKFCKGIKEKHAQEDDQ